MARAFLERIGIKAAIVNQVVRTGGESPGKFKRRTGSPRRARFAAWRCALRPPTFLQLLRVIEADHSGRPPLLRGLPEGALRIRDMAVAQAVEEKPQAPLILGPARAAVFRGRARQAIGEVVDAALEAQADGEFSTHEEALAWLERFVNNLQRR